MTNVLNSILANQAIKPSMQRGKNPAFTFNTDGKVKPLEDRATLLPSRIFGSPIEYAKDLKQDIVNIGRAFKGKANDHELGRINDVAMKLGSLALAGYLFCKTPGKLGKVMEFVGFGTFFGSMALWPKLAIQAPLKARTGVDIHRKYVDSQGRKKMLHQDPQYDLTDLYGQKDLELIGKKCKVNENLPDRERFIKQRANKIATQGNTLWMMTAGVAPVMSALACNVLEKPLAKTIETVDLKTSQKAINRLSNEGIAGGVVSRLKQRKAAKVVEKFLRENAGSEVDEALAIKLSDLIRTPDPSIKTAVKDQIMALGSPKQVSLTSEKIITTLKGVLSALEANGVVVSGVDVDALVKANESALKNYLDSPQSIASVIAGELDKQNLPDVFDDLVKGLEQASLKRPKLSEISGQVKTMHSSLLEFISKKNVLDRFKNVRIGQNADSYIAHQWNNISETLIDELKFSQKELKRISRGEVSKILAEKLEDLATKPEKYAELISKLSKMISDYEQTMGGEFTSTVTDQIKKMSTATGSQLSIDDFKILSKHFKIGENGSILKGTISSKTAVDVADRIAGAKSSFYRVLQTLDFFKRSGTDDFKAMVKNLIEEAGVVADDDLVKQYIDAAKKVLFEATNTTYIEKLDTSGFKTIMKNVSETPGLGDSIKPARRYDIIMKMLFDESKGAGSEIGDKADGVIKGFKTYLNDMLHVVTKENPFSEAVKDSGKTLVTNAPAESEEIGKQIISYFKDSADKAFNSKHWKKIWIVSMLAITAVTVVATFFIGRKSKMEKQVEQELKLNG